MDEGFDVEPSQLLEAASDFCQNPGAPSDASAQEFLSRFPLPAVVSALQTKSDYPGLENVVVCCLERIFGTKYGASLIPHYMPFVSLGLREESQEVRRLACIAISCLLKDVDKSTSFGIFRQYDIYTLLLNCYIEGDERVYAASMDAIIELAGHPDGLEVIFPEDSNDSAHLGYFLTKKCSSVGRVRVLALMQRLFSVSSAAASKLSNLNLLSLFEAEVRNTSDTLVTLSVLELLYDFVQVQNSVVLLSKTGLLELMSTIISNPSAYSSVRSRAMMITGRLLSSGYAFEFVDESSVRNILSVIDRRLDLPECQASDECEFAIEALGQIGSSLHGVSFLLSHFPSATRHVVDAAFDQQHHGKQLAALHSLANIAGEKRTENEVLLNSQAEENFRGQIYDKASNTSKLTPSGLLLSVLQQDSEIRFAGYRLMTGAVARSWCLREIFSRPQIIDIVTDTSIEIQKIGMEARHRCCEAIFRAFKSSSDLNKDLAATDTASKVAIRRGPFRTRENMEAQPMVMTAERF